MYALILAALVCSAFARPCRAMLVTPESSEDAADRVRQAITQRLSNELSPENARRAIRREFAPSVTALESLKTSVIASHKIDAEQAENQRAASVFSIALAAVGMAILFPLAVFGVFVRMTRRAMACRERERLSMLRINPKPPGEEETAQLPKRKTPAISLKEFLAQRAARAANAAQTPAESAPKTAPESVSPTPLPG